MQEECPLTWSTQQQNVSEQVDACSGFLSATQPTVETGFLKPLLAPPAWSLPGMVVLRCRKLR